MAIAFNAFSEGGNASDTSSITFAHTCNGANRHLIVDVTYPFTDILTGVTYAGVPMTLVGKVRSTANNGWVYTYLLVNPASGTNNVVVSASANTALNAGATSYTGVHQTIPTNGVYVSGEPFVATHTLTMNIQIANCWMHGFFVTNTAQTQSTGYTIRGTSGWQRYTVGDSNGGLSAGNYSMSSTTTNASSRYWVGIAVVLVPAGATFMMFDAASSSTFGTGTVNTSPTVTTWSHTNGGEYLLVSYLEFTGVAVTVSSATYNGISMTALGTNSFYLLYPPKGTFNISVSLTHASSWTGSGIGYVAGSWKSTTNLIKGPTSYTSTSNGTNTISSALTIPTSGAWHIGMGYGVGNAGGLAGLSNTVLRNSVNVPNCSYYLGIIDSGGTGSFPGSQTLAISNTSTLNQGVGIMDMMIEFGTIENNASFLLLMMK